VTAPGSQYFDEMGIAASGEGQALRERLAELVEGPAGHVLLLGEAGTGRSQGLELFARSAREQALPLLERHGQLWRHVHAGGETLSRELWPLLAGVKGEQAALAVDNLDEVDSRGQAQLAEAVARGRSDLKLCLLASGHCALVRLAASGGFSEALWKVFPEERIVHLPPLRQDPAQIPVLARRFVRQSARRFDIDPPPKIQPKALAHLQAYAWPGNIRQLHQVLERAVLSCTDGEITAGHLPAWLLDGDEYGLMRAARASMSLEDLERCYIEIVLKTVGGHRSRAAAILGINRKTLATKIQRLGITVPASANGPPPRLR
jgi:transcriptional regulator with AAA-type ATPase domain